MIDALERAVARASQANEVAAAIRTERERCARLARHCLITYAASGNLEDEAKQIELARRNIEAAILKPDVHG